MTATKTERLALIDGTIELARRKIEAYEACTDRHIIFAWPQHGLGVLITGPGGNQSAVVDLLQASAICTREAHMQITNGKGEKAERVERRFAAWAYLPEAKRGLQFMLDARERIAAEQD